MTFSSKIWGRVKTRPLYLVNLAWLVAAGGMLASLYFSEVNDLLPCELCWYQRICMYSLVVILGIASYRQDVKVYVYGLPLAIIGAGIAAYHYYLQMFADGASAFCSSTVSCTTTYYKVLGFMTIPFGAFFTFLAIIVLLGAALKLNRQEV